MKSPFLLEILVVREVHCKIWHLKLPFWDYSCSSLLPQYTLNILMSSSLTRIPHALTEHLLSIRQQDVLNTVMKKTWSVTLRTYRPVRGEGQVNWYFSITLKCLRALSWTPFFSLSILSFLIHVYASSSQIYLSGPGLSVVLQLLTWNLYLGIS